jgi:hypothetical protein
MSPEREAAECERSSSRVDLPHVADDDMSCRLLGRTPAGQREPVVAADVLERQVDRRAGLNRGDLLRQP